MKSAFSHSIGGLAFQSAKITHATTLYPFEIGGRRRRFLVMFFTSSTRHFISWHCLTFSHLYAIHTVIQHITLKLSNKGNAQSFHFKNLNQNIPPNRNLYKYVTQKFLYDNLTRVRLYATQVPLHFCFSFFCSSHKNRNKICEICSEHSLHS